jgi:hypothetical protein
MVLSPEYTQSPQVRAFTPDGCLRDNHAQPCNPTVISISHHFTQVPKRKPQAILVSLSPFATYFLRATLLVDICSPPLLALLNQRLGIPSEEAT